MRTIELKVKGMHCRSCEILLSDALTEAGVKDCKVDSQKGTAAVTFEEKSISLEKIKQIIKKEGYSVN